MHALKLLWAAHNEEVFLRRHQRQLQRYRLEKVQNMPDGFFIDHFRLNKETFKSLCEDLLQNTKLRGTREIPLEIKVLCALSFLAVGSYQRPIGAMFGLTQRTTSRCIRQVVAALNEKTILEKWISFPQTQPDRNIVKQKFQRKFNLPGVVGCIDCTHISIEKPTHEEHLFFNRKGYHSLNVQMICDSDMKILNVNAKFGGATHDSYIWSSSQVEPYMRQLHGNGEHVWLLGDSGYPLRPWLMTPILNAASGSREEQYTKRHVEARNCIERCFGLLKARWRCINKARALHYHPQVASQIVISCCVLHNIAISANIPPPSPLDSVEEVSIESDLVSSRTEDESDLLRGRAVQHCLINRL